MCIYVFIFIHIHPLRYKYWVVVSNIFYFHPEPWGNDPIWWAFFSKGWLNHQLEKGGKKLKKIYVCVNPSLSTWSEDLLRTFNGGTLPGSLWRLGEEAESRFFGPMDGYKFFRGDYCWDVKFFVVPPKNWIEIFFCQFWVNFFWGEPKKEGIQNLF